MIKLIAISAIILNIITEITSNDVLGCGGFIKSHVPIDFSKVEIKLFTKHGILKDKTSCAPNNGYYFMPLYDKGEYTLQLEPPAGWSFHPTNVKLVIDGATDLCSQGKDINFAFQGFGITGKVDNLRSDVSGPAGVEVKLKSDNEVRKTITTVNGNFFFTPVYPGNYVVSISHPNWRIGKNSVLVKVAEGNTELPSQSLTIGGYIVTGTVRSYGEPIKNVNLVLYQDANDKGPIEIYGCDISFIQEVQSNDKQICHVRSNDQGLFTFPTVSSGSYYIVPFYKGQNIHFEPMLMRFTVISDNVALDKIFEITGFSVLGKVLKSENGDPIVGANVFLNGQIIGVTQKDGTYLLDRIKAGSYKLQIQADDLQFEEKTLKVNPNILQLPDVMPSAFKVSGFVLSEKPQVVTITNLNNPGVMTIMSEPVNGEFSIFLSPGKYQIQVTVDHADKEQGLQFFPLSHTTQVTNTPISGMTFSQLKAVISGKVICIEEGDCNTLLVILRPIVSDASIEVRDTTIKLKGGSYTFKDIRPGMYEVLLTPNKLCWKENKQTITVSAAVVNVPPFTQTGYGIIFISSHDTKVLYKPPVNDSNALSLDIARGRSLRCVEKPGSYEFTLTSCHIYEENTTKYNTNSSSNEIYLAAQKHQILLSIESKEKLGDIYMTINAGGVKTQEGPLTYKNNKYHLELYLTPTESVVLVPQSDILFFNPPILSINGENDCADVGIKFAAVKGKVFQGKITPPLLGVIVTVETENSEALMDETDVEGNYKFPPLDDTKMYKISAKKDSYVLVGPNEHGNFAAHKLAEVIVEIVDQTDNLPLQGALLSLSGGNSYRSNLQTNENGKISFHSLSPNEYFLRPMMKEYSFEPSSKIIDVIEGVTVRVLLKGKRVAYSAFGQITSLNGEPENGMIITATGLKNCSRFSEETATSESNGKFRIRGLQPYCSYEIKVKGNLDDKQPIERAAPSTIILPQVTGDVVELKIIAFRPTPNADILVKVYAANPEHYKSLRLKLLRESQPGAIHTIKFESFNYKLSRDANPGILVQVPSIPFDEKVYSIQLESTLLQASRLKPQTQHFTANSSFKYFYLEFSVKANSTDQHIKQTSVWTLVFIFGSMLAVYNIELLANLVKEKCSKLNFGAFSTLKNKPAINENFIDNNEIDQIVQSINYSTKRKSKPKKI